MWYGHIQRGAQTSATMDITSKKEDQELDGWRESVIKWQRKDKANGLIVQYGDWHSEDINDVNISTVMYNHSHAGMSNWMLLIIFTFQYTTCIYLSPSRRRWNCSTKRHLNVGPTLAPSSWSSRIPPTQISKLPENKKHGFDHYFKQQETEVLCLSV
jgi:hypothetical protein